jgi:valyl-tRNA synthetase
LVKGRAYGEEGEDGTDSARTTLRIAIETLVKLFAPFLPYVCEEVWSWFGDGSIHRSSWPESTPLRELVGDFEDPEFLATARQILSAVRKAKTAAQVSMKTAVSSVAISGSEPDLQRARAIEADLRRAGVVAGEISYSLADELAVVSRLT